LRISLGMPTTQEELDLFFKAVARVMPRVMVQ
jgi:selenocysteine lyase/cysteine desulfurase